jgi:hypothetical protein
MFAQGVEVLSSLGASTLKKYEEGYLIVGIIVVVMIQILMTVVGLIIVNQVIHDVKEGVARSDISKSLSQNLKYVFVEFCRMLVRIILFGVLLIVPGFIQWIKLTFAPFVAQFDEEYKRGKVDALERSRELVKGRFFPFSGVLLLALFLSIVPSFWLGATELFEKPVLFTMLFFFSMVFELYASIVVYCAYRRLSAQSTQPA